MSSLSQQIRTAVGKDLRLLMESVAREVAARAAESLIKKRVIWGPDWIAVKHLQPVERLLGKLQ